MDYLKAIWWCDFSAAMSNITGRSSDDTNRDYESIKPWERKFELVDMDIVNRYIPEGVPRDSIIEFMSSNQVEEFVLLAD